MSRKIFRISIMAGLLGGTVLSGAIAAPGDSWHNYGNDAGAQRYSPLTQITPANVNSLKVAWTYHMKPADATRVATSQTTPLLADGVMYLGSPYGNIVALDPVTGKELWKYKLLAGRQGLCARAAVRHQ
jgi:quinoprotein glucose dehydrogenase